MEKDNNSMNVTVSYVQEDNLIHIMMDNEDNQITLSPSMYLPFISVLLSAGIDMENDSSINLGFSKVKE